MLTIKRNNMQNTHHMASQDVVFGISAMVYVAPNGIGKVILCLIYDCFTLSQLQ